MLCTGSWPSLDEVNWQLVLALRAHRSIFLCFWEHIVFPCFLRFSLDIVPSPLFSKEFLIFRVLSVLFLIFLWYCYNFVCSLLILRPWTTRRKQGRPRWATAWNSNLVRSDSYLVRHWILQAAWASIQTKCFQYLTWNFLRAGFN